MFEVLLHSSVDVLTAPGEPSPLIASPSVLSAPAPAKLNLPAFKSATSVQVTPFHSSVKPTTEPGAGAPPKAKADVAVPFPANSSLAVFKILC